MGLRPTKNALTIKSGRSDKINKIMEEKDIILHFAQDADDFLNDMRTIRLSCEIETDSLDNVVAVSRKVNSRLLKNRLEMEIIIGLMKIYLINKVNKKRPSNL